MRRAKDGGGGVNAVSGCQWRSRCVDVAEAMVGQGFREATMQSKYLRFGKGFRPAFSVRGVQAAEMVLPPGDSEGGPDNFHRGADQWLFVVAGTGLAIVDGARRRLREGSLLVIERGERHEIRNTGRTPLRTLNFYSPPAYTADGETLPPGRRGPRKHARG